ncbi:hypothetical protein [Archangium lipolyticum]|uniref:hypothetical protein n=1 Tax=Archangium lipolyticum TaxID=2970465 RepID=UPI00214A1F70|nr:hypothetical protein [Archangium lipolyticum]
MGITGGTARRDLQSARWTVLMGAACAFLLAVLAGVCPGGEDAGTDTGVRWTSVTRQPAPMGSVSAARPGSPEQRAAIQDPSFHGRLELSRPAHKPTPHPKRADRHDLAARLEAWLPVQARTHLWRTKPVYQDRLADRPVVANCPAQGPPRTA